MVSISHRIHGNCIFAYMNGSFFLFSCIHRQIYHFPNLWSQHFLLNGTSQVDPPGPGTFLHRRGTWPRCSHTLRSLGKDWRSGCSKSTSKTAGERSEKRNNKTTSSGKKGQGFRMVGSVLVGWFGDVEWFQIHLPSTASRKISLEKNMQHLQGRDVGVGWDAVLGGVGWGCGLTMIEYGWLVG